VTSPSQRLPLQRHQLVADGLAGLTLAALAIPEVMGYTRISQTPVVTGLYTLLLPMVAFALLGASRHLVVAADSATAAILVGTLAAVATPGSTPYVGLTMAVALVVSLFLLPAAVLSTIVFLIGLKLIDWTGLSELWRLQRHECLIALATLITVAQVGVMPGITLAVVLSLIEQVRHTYRPRTSLWTPRSDGTGLHTVPVAPAVFAAAGILAYRFEANLFYANANRFTQEVLAIASQPQAEIRGLVVDASGVDDVDYTAGKALQDLGIFASVPEALQALDADPIHQSASTTSQQSSIGTQR